MTSLKCSLDVGVLVRGQVRRELATVSFSPDRYGLTRLEFQEVPFSLVMTRFLIHLEGGNEGVEHFRSEVMRWEREAEER